MKFKAMLCACAAMGLGACSYGAADGFETAPVLAPVETVLPPERDPAELQVLFWSDAERSARFREMENWFPGLEVPPASNPRELTEGEPLPTDLAQDIRKLMLDTHAAGVLVWEDGAVRFEDYALGFTPEQRWTSFSVAKSFTSTLLGAALKDGFIASLDDPVTQYVPGLAGSAYDGVTVRQIATMTSGVRWNEDYTDPDSDVAAMNRFVVEYGPDAIVEQMKRLERQAPAGEKWVYKTGETNLIGMVVENAVGLPLAQYAQEKIVEPAGFEHGMFWMTDPRGGNIGGCCLSLTLRDYARMGIFALEDAGKAVPENWFAEAGSPLVEFDRAGFGYGYQWWTYPNGYGAQGIFGQSITIIPEERLVVAIVSNWPAATGDNRGKWFQMVGRIAAAD